jgi:hypothetical protein
MLYAGTRRLVNGGIMLTIKKQGTDKKTYMYGLAAMAVCSAGAVTAMALGSSLTGQVASVTPTKKSVTKDTSASATPSESPAADVDDESAQGAAYQGTSMTASTASSSSSTSGASSSTPSPSPSVDPTPTPTETPTVPDPTPTPPVEPPVETPTE